MSYKPINTTDYQGKQVIIDSDRLLFNAKNDSILLFSDKAIGFSTKGSIHFDDASDDKTLSFYEKDSLIEGNLSSLKLKNKDSKNIKYKDTKPLKNELKYFIEILKGAQVKKANIDEGIDVIKILEMATNSLEIKTD